MDKTPNDKTCTEVLDCPIGISICIFKIKGRLALPLFESCRNKGCCYNCEEYGTLCATHRESSFNRFIRKKRYLDWIKKA